MWRTASALVLLVIVYVGLVLANDVIGVVFQPVLMQGSGEGTLRTFDQKGDVYENRLAVVDDGETPWIQSGHYFRGWYYRLLDNPEVEPVRDGKVRVYRAVPIDTPETEELVSGLLKQRIGSLRFYAIRTVLGFADMKPVRLDPR
jgi:hypothetical protein